MLIIDIALPLIPIALAIWACIALFRLPSEETADLDDSWFDRHKR
ncbi:hypothetical protein HNR59_002857 [Aquamicrobium lusatiense]|uniref:Uncharacterized protein n=1 Tax=Aquamicrobium lusatiense TaxID=89772 RepID=A0A7W9S5Q1_9HYPH|nr:hypothetical protein [Aquamicrobium lusatiense]MBB6013468.1 hypothetical protein [Aquamicrobium lusatiense]